MASAADHVGVQIAREVVEEIDRLVFGFDRSGGHAEAYRSCRWLPRAKARSAKSRPRAIRPEAPAPATPTHLFFGNSKTWHTSPVSIFRVSPCLDSNRFLCGFPAGAWKFCFVTEILSFAGSAHGRCRRRPTAIDRSATCITTRNCHALLRLSPAAEAAGLAARDCPADGRVRLGAERARSPCPPGPGRLRQPDAAPGPRRISQPPPKAR